MFLYTRAYYNTVYDFPSFPPSNMLGWGMGRGNRLWLVTFGGLRDRDPNGTKPDQRLQAMRLRNSCWFQAEAGRYEILYAC